MSGERARAGRVRRSLPVLALGLLMLPAPGGSAPMAVAEPLAASRTRGPSAGTAPDSCPRGLGPQVLDGDLPLLRERIRSGRSLRIVTIGSSSTAGSGASSSRTVYPSRLAAELLHWFPTATIEVINAGIGGEEIAQMAERLERDALAHQPDLVIWQFGSNAVVRGMALNDIDTLARDGIARIRRAGAEPMLMDLQHVPTIEASPSKQRMLDLIRGVAHDTGTALFRRYDLMRAWHTSLGDDYARMFAIDRLHMNDASYVCMAAALAAAIHDRVGRAATARTTERRHPPAVRAAPAR